MAERFLQLKRNGTIYEGRTTGFNVVSGSEFLASKKDGEPIAVRYLIDSTQEASATNIAVAVGHVVVDGDNKYIVLNDLQGVKETLTASIAEVAANVATNTSNLAAINSAVGVNVGDNNITSQMANTNYLSGETNVTGALSTLDDKVKDSEDALSNIETVVGVTTADTQMTGLTGYTLSGLVTSNQASTTNALNKLDQVIIENEEVVENAIEKIVSAAGFDSNPIAYSVDTTAKYIGTSTNVKMALKQLNDALAALKTIANITSPLAYDSTTETISLNYDSSKVCSDVTSTDEIAMHNSIIAVDDNDALYALSDLHYDSSTNKLTFINTNGKKEIQLTGVEMISSATYVSSAETLELVVKLLNGQTQTITIPMSGLIEEYSFQPSESGATASSTSHNVALFADRDVSGSTEVYGNIDVFDCGEY